MTQAPDARVRLGALLDPLRDAALDVVWRQWRSIGGQAAGQDIARSIVDPEALLLLSLTRERDEPRLTDVVRDWVLLNSDVLSVQRARNLSLAYPTLARDRLAWVAPIAAEEGKDMRWRALADGEGDKRARMPSASRTNKRRAIRVPLSNPSALLLRLRLGLGVGVKADLFGYLLGINGQWATVRDIVTATAYTPAAVRRAADDMAGARLLQVRSGSPAGYRVDPSPWRDVLDLRGHAPAWQSWHERFAFVAAFLEWATAIASTSVGAYALGVQGRELLARYQGAFERDFVMAWDEHAASHDAMSFTEAGVRAMADWMVEQA